MTVECHRGLIVERPYLLGKVSQALAIPGKL